MNSADKFYKEKAVPVKVQLSNGHLRYGILLDEPEQGKRLLNNAWRFISNSNFAEYIKTGSQHLIELLPDKKVVCLDIALK